MNRCKQRLDIEMGRRLQTVGAGGFGDQSQTAKALGLTIPYSLMLQATEMIE